MKVTVEQDKITVEGEDMQDVWFLAKLYACYRGWINLSLAHERVEASKPEWNPCVKDYGGKPVDFVTPPKPEPFVGY